MTDFLPKLRPYWILAGCPRRFMVWFATLLTSALMLGAGICPASVIVSPSIDTSLEMQGNYVFTGVSNNGTLGVGGNTSPGLVFDPDGTGNFGGKPDYLTPGDPAEGFSIFYAGAGSPLINNNSGGTFGIGSALTPTDVSDSSAYDNAVRWTGTVSDVLTVDHVYAFDADQSNVGITTTITALTDLTDLQFARWIDPDSGGTSSINNRGNASLGLAAGDWVNSVSETNGATLGLYSESSVTHNTGISPAWSQIPMSYITGGLDGDGTTTQHTGDDMIGIGFDIGVLSDGQSVVFEYAYVVTADENDLDVGVGKWIGDTDNDWDNATNWDPEAAASDGEKVNIESSGNPTVNHNVTGNTYANWTFNASSAAVEIQGNDVTIGDGRTVRNASSNLQTFGVGLNAAGSLTIEGGTDGLAFQAIQVADGSTLTFDTGSSDSNVVSGVISGVGSALTVAGTGTLQLSGDNTYSGGTSINGGSLRISQDGNLGDAAGGLSLNGGTLEASADLATARDMTLNASGGTFDTNGANVQLSGNIAGAGSLTKLGAGTLTLSGTNTFGGGTTIAAGTLAGSTSSLPGDIANNAALEFNQVTDGTYTGHISGNGSVTKLGAGTLTLSGTNTYSGLTTVDAGGLVLNGSSTSDFSVVAGARMGGDATLGSLNNGGTVAPGNSIGTTTVNGDYTNEAAGTYEVEINPAGESDLIDVTGTATIAGGTVDVQPEAGIYTPGTRYTILEADGGVTGAFDTLTGSVTGARPQLFYNANDIELFLAPLYLVSARTPNQRAVATELERLALAPTGDIGTVLRQLDTVVDMPGGEAYFDQLGGELFGTTASAGIENTSLFIDSISRRLRTMGAFDAAGNSGFSGGLATQSLDGLDGAVVRGQSPSWLTQEATCWRPWVQGYGVSGNVDGDGNASHFDYGIGGTTVGIDRALTDITRIGFVGGYSNSQVDISNPRQRAAIDSAQFAVYLHRRDCCCRYLTGIFSYAYNDYDTSRQIAFGDINRTASADYDGNEISFFLESGRVFQWGALQFQPYGTLNYIGLRQSRFAETGAGAMSLAVDDTQTDSFRGQLGSRLVWYNRRGEGRVLAPELRAVWRHEFLDQNRLVNASFSGAPGGSFVVAGANLGRDAAVLGGGCSAYFGTQLSIFANYDLLVNNTEVTHVGSGGLQFVW